MNELVEEYPHSLHQTFKVNLFVPFIHQIPICRFLLPLVQFVKNFMFLANSASEMDQVYLAFVLQFLMYLQIQGILTYYALISFYYKHDGIDLYQFYLHNLEYNFQSVTITFLQ